MIGYTCKLREDADCSTITIIDGKPPNPDRLTPPNRPLYALKKALQNRVFGYGLITVSDKQQGKMMRDLLPRIREFVWLRSRFPRRYERENVIEEMENMEEAPQ